MKISLPWPLVSFRGEFHLRSHLESKLYSLLLKTVFFLEDYINMKVKSNLGTINLRHVQTVFVLALEILLGSFRFSSSKEPLNVGNRSITSISSP
jgi:hypothetical protein